MAHYVLVKKRVLLYPNAQKELLQFPRQVQLKFKALIEILTEEGKLEPPYAKKLSGSDDLFEIRVKHQGQWRALYAYIESSNVLILTAFAKKTQKTPVGQLVKAKKRLQVYRAEKG